MIVEFQDQEAASGHRQFQSWRQRHPDGLILNQKNRSVFLLHACNCPHLGDPKLGTQSTSPSGRQRWHNLVRSRKICASIPELLIAWAEQAGIKVQTCRDCHPDEESKHCLAYHNADDWGEFTAKSGKCRHFSRFPKSRLEKYLGRSVWVVVGETIFRRKAYTLGSCFRPTRLEPNEDGFWLVGNGIYLGDAEISLGSFNWFDTLRQRLGHGVTPINDRSVVQGLARASLLQAGEASEIAADDGRKYPEGAVRQITVNAYERDRRARDECVRIHGTRCKICDFDFGERYGELGEGFIHVHHLTPVGSVEGPYEVDPKTQLLPVCPNCHAMLHRMNPPIGIDELKARVNRGQ